MEDRLGTDIGSEALNLWPLPPEITQSRWRLRVSMYTLHMKKGSKNIRGHIQPVGKRNTDMLQSTDVQATSMVKKHLC